MMMCACEILLFINYLYYYNILLLLFFFFIEILFISSSRGGVVCMFVSAIDVRIEIHRLSTP